MLYKELEDCEECPIKEEGICSGGWTSGYGGEPIEPPCTMFDDDTDLDEWINSYHASEYAYEELMDIEYEEKKAKELKNKIARDKRCYLKSRCIHEIVHKNQIEKRLKSLKSIASTANSLASAINITNEMFRYSERVHVNTELENEIEKLKQDLELANKELKDKQAKIRKSDEYKNIGKDFKKD